MSRLFVLILSIFFLNQCSLNEGSRLWKDNQKEIDNQTNIKKEFLEEKKITTEFNKDLKLNLKEINTNNKILSNSNNYGIQDYNGLIKNFFLLIVVFILPIKISILFFCKLIILKIVSANGPVANL